MGYSSKKICNQCDAVKKMIDDFNHKDYLENLYKLDELTEQGVLELYAGDSPIEDVKIHCEREDRYTINHYFRCKKCGKFFFIGFCCRGGVIFKEKSNAGSIDYNHIFDGKEKLGAYFKERIHFY